MRMWITCGSKKLICKFRGFTSFVAQQETRFIAVDIELRDRMVIADALKNRRKLYTM